MLGAPQTADGIVEDIADIAFAHIDYSPGRFTVTEFLDLPNGYPTGWVGSHVAVDFYNEFKPKEWDNMHLLFLNAGTTAGLMLHDKKITSLDQLKGVTLRGAGAIGGAGALIIGLVRRELTKKGFFESSREGLRISCMILLLIAGATIFGRFIAMTQIPATLASWAGTLEVPSWVIITMLYVFWFILGCFVDAMALIVLLVPIFYPLVIQLGYDPIWFGVIITIFSMIAVVTPPVGVNAYVVKGLFKEIPLETVFKGILPFLVPFTVATALTIAFPQIATILPHFITY